MDDIEYLLDQSNVIVAIEGAWNAFAEHNAGKGLDDESVLGQPLLDFISGKATKQYWLAVFSQVRQANSPVSVDYRCDAPFARRFMRMTLTPQANGALRIRSQLLQENPLPQPVLISRSEQRSQLSRVRCSLCNRISQQGAWFEAEQLSRLNACFTWQVTYGVCPDCQDVFTEACKQ